MNYICTHKKENSMNLISVSGSPPPPRKLLVYADVKFRFNVLITDFYA